MKQVFRVFWGCTLAAALALTGCGRGGAPGSSGAGSMSGSGSGAMSGGTAGQEQAWRTGLGVVTEAAGSDRAGKITTAAAAVVLDADGKLADVMLDELELSVSGGSTGSVTTPEDVRSKRTKGEDYPLAAASSLGKGWAEQADWFADYLTGRTPDEVKKLTLDENGTPQDADLVSGCTIAVDRYRDAVVRACEQAKALGAAQGDRVTLSLIAADLPQDLAATDDQDAHVRADITLAALTVDSDGRVTSAIGDMTQPQLTVSADGTVSGPEEPVYTKNEQGDKYGMREASALHKEWYEHAEGYCSTLKGKTMAEIAAQPTDGSDADLKALCTISVTDLQKAVLAALAET